jgi:hypothetical protein
MIQIDDKIIHTDVFTKKFTCDMEKCMGRCCVFGDSGAPLTGPEVKEVEKVYPLIKKLLRPEAVAAIEQQGAWLIDSDGDRVTPLINKKECAYTIFDRGIARCAFEIAFFIKITRFRKPLSCHLYPIRTKKYETFEAVNYNRWDICAPALEMGEKTGQTVMSFCKEALIRAYGKAFYKKMQAAANQLQEQ